MNKIWLSALWLFTAALLGFISPASGDPATQPTPLPTTQPDSPQAALIAWNEFENMSVDSAKKEYYCTNADDQKLATALATESVAQGKFQKAVREKWGRDAEAQVARVCDSDTLADDKAATTRTLDADHALIQFQNPDLDELPLIRVNSNWKIDVRACGQALGNQIDANIQACYKTATLLDATKTALASDQYPDADHLADYLDEELEKLNPPAPSRPARN